MTLVPMDRANGMTRTRPLDGLRGVAILLVVAVHAGLLPGGGHGVTLFFVLSGFLITRLLVAEADSGQRDLKRFYWNRMLRLFPALLLMVATVTLAFEGTDWFWPLAYTANYAGIMGASLQNLVHTWSLAVEEHFYLIWPLAMMWIPSQGRKRWFVGLFATAVAWRLLLLIDGVDYTWIYAATDTAAYALLAGCLMAVLDWTPSKAATVGGVVGLVAVTWFVQIGTYSYLWAGFLVVGFSMIAVAGCAHHRVRALELRWLTELGMISYGVYLWHLPLLNSGLSTPIALVLTVAVATLSWRVVEQPLRRFRISADRSDQMNPRTSTPPGSHALNPVA